MIERDWLTGVRTRRQLYLDWELVLPTWGALAVGYYDLIGTGNLPSAAEAEDRIRWAAKVLSSSRPFVYRWGGDEFVVVAPAAEQRSLGVLAACRQFLSEERVPVSHWVPLEAARLAEEAWLAARGRRAKPRS